MQHLVTFLERCTSDYGVDVDLIQKHESTERMKKKETANG